MENALAFLGVGPMQAYHPQADTLEGEVDDYLSAPTKYVNAVVFWQVCINCSLLRSADSSWDFRNTRGSGQPSSSLPWT